MLAGVHQRERHRDRIGQQHRPPPPADPAEEEHHHEQGERRVQRGHRRHRVGRPLASVQDVARAMKTDRLPAPRRDAHHLGKQAELRGPPGRRGGIGEVGDQPQRGQREPPSHERRPQLAAPQPERHRDPQRRDEVREVDPAGDDVVPPDRVRVVQVLLEPHRRHVAAEHEPVGLDQFEGVGRAALVGQAAREVVDHQQDHDGQPVAGEQEVHPARLIDANRDRGKPQPDEGEDRIRQREPEEHPPRDETDTPECDRDRPLPSDPGGIASGVRLLRWNLCGGGHRHQG